ncbi:MAG: N-acetyl-gamma-glutamyl-phosphate reductase [Deltaproteobacteria bacterium GWB2_55_19]|nr:MAG: N-acetyl-gamma-glutamyl-phosphate reductase [Deltaproteobacteria bacterium GWB2_55_19]HAO93972.1 N-acetyl-gamma-glutamyl-phosphate reductase [Deltaproteobacteria bacterium]
MLKVAIVGGSGYTGFELLRILALHPNAQVTEATSRQYKGKAVAEVFPSLSGFYDRLRFSEPEDLKGLGADIAFSALPHGVSQGAVTELLKSSRVIDLSADFRIRDLSVYRAWYGDHASAELLKEAVYGLPELKRKEIKGARLVANPGCYPTSAILALVPLLKEKLADASSIIVDSKSGVSGAGRSAALDTSFVEVSHGFKAYKIGSHRHTPEIEQELGAIAGAEVSITFTPHLLPVSRGILSTVYVDLAKGVSMKEVLSLYRAFYEKEPFVRVMDEGRFPDISQVRASNFCDLGVFVDEKKGKAIIVSAIDNLVKGASGQAVQNMNIMAGFPETTGLIAPPVSI